MTDMSQEAKDQLEKQVADAQRRVNYLEALVDEAIQQLEQASAQLGHFLVEYYPEDTS